MVQNQGKQGNAAHWTRLFPFYDVTFPFNFTDFYFLIKNEETSSYSEDIVISVEWMIFCG